MALKDYTEEALSLLLPQFDNSPKLKGLLESAVEPTIEWQDGLEQMLLAYDVRVCGGEPLDKLGKLLNVVRGDKSDEDFRSAILARILINKSTGSGKNLIEMLRLVLGDDVGFRVVEQYPASVQIIIYKNQNVIDKQVVDDILPIGVRGIFFGNPYEGKDIWTLSDVEADGSIPSPDPYSILPDVADLSTTNLVIVDVTYIT